MPFKKILMHGFVLAYLTMTFLAFCFTMFRWRPLGIKVIFPFYGMMAPYQGYSEEHVEMIAEGQKDGTWTRIDILKYYPGRRGEGVIRQQMRIMKWFYGEEALGAGHKKLAELIRDREADSGHSYDRVRLSWEIWPVSMESYEAQRHDPFVRRAPIIEVP